MATRGHIHGKQQQGMNETNNQLGDLKFRDLAKLCFFKLIMTKSNLKNSYDVISVTSLPLRHRKMSPINVTIFSKLGLSNQNFWL